MNIKSYITITAAVFSAWPCCI